MNKRINVSGFTKKKKKQQTRHDISLIIFISECMKRDVQQSQVSLDKVCCIISSIKTRTHLNKVHHILLRNGRNDFTGCRLCNAQCDKYTQQHMAAVGTDMQIRNVNVNLCVHISKSRQLCNIKLHIFYTHIQIH